jgi:spore coat protein U-like protein
LISSQTAANIHSQIYHKHSLANLSGAITMKYSNVLKSALPAAALGFLALGLTSTPAVAAATATATFNVTASVQATCTVSATDMAFGTYTGVDAIYTSNLTITCTKTTPYTTIGLSAGGGGGAVDTRKMSGTGADKLGYGLYTDSARTLNWNDTGGTGLPGGTGNGTGQTILVYGKIPGGQYITPGSYTDTIIATVNY